MQLVSTQILATATQVFNDEIAGLLQIQQNLANNFVDAIELLVNCTGKVVVSGMGKSGHIGHKIAATLASTGTPAFFMHPAEALHGDLGMVMTNDVLIAISYSGESDELNAILPLIRRKQVKIISLTGNVESSLAKLSDCVLNIKINKEACPLNLAPTTSTTATLVLGDALAVSLLSLRNFQPEDFALSHPGGSLGRKLLTKVSDIMHSGERLPVVNQMAGFNQVVFEISNKGLGFVAVVDDEQQLVGIITDGDLRRCLDGKQSLVDLIASQIMSHNPKTVLAESMAIDAVEIVNQYKINGLLVVNSNHQVIGAFNVHDLFKAKLI
ncbi:MAG: hypothetical protein RLZZ293_1056 [Pseudomonadota bacterium]|jgi:arabinose-5-phosphate isomerase